MKKVMLLVGLPACGKTTFAKELQNKEPNKWKRISKDDLRSMLDDWSWTPQNEDFTLKARDFLILQALKDGWNVIVDDTNLNAIHPKHIREIVKDLAQVEIKDFTDVPLEECINRDRKRAKPVGYKVIRDFYFKYLARPKPKVTRDPQLPDAIICDLDGTLALFEGHRSPYDASKADEDVVNEPVAQLLHNYYKIGVKIIFVSGRRDLYRRPTIKFLEKNGFYQRVIITKGVEFNPRLVKHLGQEVIYESLYMRPNFLLDGKTEDNRKDWIVKKEIYENNIKGKYNILFVLDDRNQVVDLCWRAQGLPCFQVNDGDF